MDAHADADIDAHAEIADAIATGWMPGDPFKGNDAVRAAHEELCAIARHKLGTKASVLDYLKAMPASSACRIEVRLDLAEVQAARNPALVKLAKTVLQGCAPPPTIAARDSIVLVNAQVDGPIAGGNMTYVDFRNQPPPDRATALRLERVYLNSLFKKPWAEVSLADYDAPAQAGAAPRAVSLFDIYVPLPIDCGIYVKARIDSRAKRFDTIDWWVTDGSERWNQKQDDARADDKQVREQQHSREWRDLDADAASVQPLVDSVMARASAAYKFDEENKDKEPADGWGHFTLEASHAAGLSPRVVLVGAAGTGKSSFVRHLALCMAGQLLRDMGQADVPANAGLDRLHQLEFNTGWPKPARALLTPLLPVYVELRQLVAAVFKPLDPDTTVPAIAPTLGNFLAFVRDQMLVPLELLGYGPELLRRMIAGEVLILLDGLDEVPDAADPRRREQIKALVRELQVYPVRMIVTSRPAVYRKGQNHSWVLDGFGRVELTALSDRRLEELATALFSHVRGGDGKSEAERFGKALKSDRLPPDLRGNPLMFTLLAALWLCMPEDTPDEQRLPRTYAEVYQRSVDLLLERWTRKRGAEPTVAETLQLTPDQMRELLQHIALMLHDRGVTAATDKERADAAIFDVEADLNPRLWRLTQHVPPLPAIEQMASRSGILISSAIEKFQFSHRSFQEYLAACELLAPSAQLYKPRESFSAVAYPGGLLKRVQAHPEQFEQVWQHAAALRCDDLSRLLPELLRGYATGGTAPEQAQSAMLAINTAQLHDVLAPTDADPYSPIAGVLRALRDAAMRALADERLVAKQRAQAGIALAALGDPRPEVLDVDAMRFVPIPAGTYWMGSPENDVDGYGDERPRHKQEVKRDYRMAKYPVTVGQWRQFREAADGYGQDEWWTGLAMPDDHRSSVEEPRFDHANHPAHNVSWYDAVAFSRWLTARWRASGKIKANEEVRLPSEAEWERAARGPAGEEETYRSRPWGNELTSEHANYDQTGIGQTTAVGCFPKGRVSWGEEALEEMIGNVWEWTTTKLMDNYADYAPDDDLGGTEGRVLRGGSWVASHRGARCASRSGLGAPGERGGNLGFRMVVSPT